MTEQPENPVGRKPISGEAAKNKTVRLTEPEWKIFREKLGMTWLREQIKKAATDHN